MAIGVRPIDGTSQTVASNAISNNMVSRDAFMQLLMAQIRYQDPFAPLSNTEFVGQLTQFSILEQNLNMSELLSAQLVLAQQQQSASFSDTAIALIGREVIVAGDTFTLEEETSESILFNTEAAGLVNLRIRDAQGQVVREVQVRAVQGYNSYVFDGKDSTGADLPEGFYTVEASTVGDGSVPSTVLETFVSGIVRAVDFSTGEVVLDLDGVTVSADGLIAVRDAARGSVPVASRTDY